MATYVKCQQTLVNIDKFKLINENYGNSTGDMVLKAITSALIKPIRREDIAARYDGEEFVLLLSHCNITNATLIAEKMRQSIENLRPSELNVTASFGVAEIQPDSAEGFPELIKATEDAVNQAKSNGGNKVIAHCL